MQHILETAKLIWSK